MGPMTPRDAAEATAAVTFLMTWTIFQFLLDSRLNALTCPLEMESSHFHALTGPPSVFRGPKEGLDCYWVKVI